MKKSLSIIRADDGIHWVMSNYTGEIVRVFDLIGIVRMIRDFRLPALF